MYKPTVFIIKWMLSDIFENLANSADLILSRIIITIILVYQFMRSITEVNEFKIYLKIKIDQEKKSAFHNF